MTETSILKNDRGHVVVLPTDPVAGETWIYMTRSRVEVAVEDMQIQGDPLLTDMATLEVGISRTSQ